MKNKILLSAVFVLTIISVKAQGEYKTAAGVRGGFYRGLTIKHFLSQKVAVEGLLSTRYYGLNVTGLIEFHNSIAEVEALNWYYGAGAHAGFYNNTYYYYNGNNNGYGLTFGADVIIGLEYTLDFFPVNFSLDWKPMFNILGGFGFRGDSGAISIRYCFNQ